MQAELSQSHHLRSVCSALSTRFQPPWNSNNLKPPFLSLSIFLGDGVKGHSGEERWQATLLLLTVFVSEWGSVTRHSRSSTAVSDNMMADTQVAALVSVLKCSTDWKGQFTVTLTLHLQQIYFFYQY